MFEQIDMKKVKIDPIAQFNLDKVHVKPGIPNIVTEKHSVRKYLEERRVKEIPQMLLDRSKAARNSNFLPTNNQKRMVWQMAAMGASAQIIRLAVIDPETGEPITETQLNGQFYDILKHAREQANFTVALKIYELAVGQDAEYDQEGNTVKPYMPPNLDALKWWDRSRGEARRLLEIRSNGGGQINSDGGVTLIIEGS